jgi:hypothetical protein
MGVARTDTVKAVNCAIGGCVMERDEADDTYRPTAIKEDEFYNYIYGSGESTDWTGTENYDGCTYLSEMPTL